MLGQRIARFGVDRRSFAGLPRNRPGFRKGAGYRLRQHAVTGGYTIERGRRRRLGALLLRVYRGKNLVYIGHTGTGFNQRTLADVREPQCA